MTRITVTAGVVALALLLAISGAAFAGEEHMTGEQKQAWKAVTDSWAAIDAEDLEWSNKWVHPDAVVWGTAYPMPRSRDSVKKWDRFNFDNSKTLASDLSIAGIVVHKDTAVAHYYYSHGTEDREGKRKTTHGRCTDILVKDGGGWKFISWHCGDMPSKDD